MKACFDPKINLNRLLVTQIGINTVMKHYNKFAFYYDRMGADKHSARMVEYSYRLFRKHKIRPSTSLDLCCGTGTAISLFLDNGITMSGLDGSAQMLAVASKKLKGREVKLYQKTLPKFRLIDPVDSRKNQQFELVTCFYDSLNYLLTVRDLRAAFRSIKMHLTDKGHFIFDMNTEHALSTIWGTNIYSGINDDLAWIWTNQYDKHKQIASCRTSFFVKEKSKWSRFDEMHLQKAFSNTTIKRLLKETGYEVLGCYDCFTFKKPIKNTNRICVIARSK